jgi:hypothetical protein
MSNMALFELIQDAKLLGKLGLMAMRSENLKS